jgi:hypothetical protein
VESALIAEKWDTSHRNVLSQRENVTTAKNRDMVQMTVGREKRIKTNGQATGSLLKVERQELQQWIKIIANSIFEKHDVTYCGTDEYMSKEGSN